MHLFTRRWGVLRVSAKLCGVAFVATAAVVKLAQAGQHTGRLDVCLALALGAIMAVVVFPVPVRLRGGGRLGWLLVQWLQRQCAHVHGLRALLEPVHLGGTLLGTMAVVAAVTAVALQYVEVFAASVAALKRFCAFMGAHCAATGCLTTLCSLRGRTMSFVPFMFVDLLMSAMLEGVGAALGRCVADAAGAGFAVKAAAAAAMATSFCITAGVLVWHLADKVIMVPVWGLGCFMDTVDAMNLEAGVNDQGEPLRFVRVPTPQDAVQGIVAQGWVTSWLWEGFLANIGVIEDGPAVAAAAAAPPLAAHHEAPTLVQDHPRPVRRARRAQKTRRRIRQRQGSVPEDACCVCLEPLRCTVGRPEVVRVVCGHHLHSSCLEVVQSQWFSQCPLCLCPIGVRYRVTMPPPAVPLLFV